MHFRSVKDIVVPLLHRFGFIVAGLQGRLGRGMLACIGALARAAYFVPNSRVRRAVCNFCRATGRSDPWPIYSRMVDNAEHAVFHYAVLSRYGRAQLLSQTVIDPSWAAEYRRFTSGKSGFLALVPHCFGGVLSSAALSSFCPTALLVRESRSPDRDKLMVDYLQKLGPNLASAGTFAGTFRESRMREASDTLLACFSSVILSSASRISCTCATE
jgi:hypothetical protein